MSLYMIVSHIGQGRTYMHRSCYSKERLQLDIGKGTNISS